MSNTIKLSARLTAIANMVPTGAKVVDIGADHALVPIFLLQKEISDFVIAVDVNCGPLAAARQNIHKYGFDKTICVRLSDGFAEITAGEVDTAIIAGMGGSQIVKILDDKIDIVNRLNWLVLQPQESAALIREWLIVNNWEIVDERLIEENDIIYEIIRAANGQKKKDLLDSFVTLTLPYEVGPILFRRRDPLLVKIIEANVSCIERIIIEMNKAKTIDKKKMAELILKKIELNGVLDSMR
ncbi:MAG: class I SAM-dependent methyltransferase [Negativicutes bacterium]|jgi:tRNA (adenine22-N1)-methyltransferase